MNWSALSSSAFLPADKITFQTPRSRPLHWTSPGSIHFWISSQSLKVQSHLFPDSISKRQLTVDKTAHLCTVSRSSNRLIPHLEETWRKTRMVVSFLFCFAQIQSLSTHRLLVALTREIKEIENLEIIFPANIFSNLSIDNLGNNAVLLQVNTGFKSSLENRTGFTAPKRNAFCLFTRT